MDKTICNTCITQAYLAQCLSESLGPKARLRAVHGEEIALGQGFLSTILRVHLTWEDPGEGLPTTAIIKVPIVEAINACLDKIESADQGKARQNVADFVTTFHLTECNAYAVFKECTPIQVPKCYAAVAGSENAPGLIVMEDLSSKASTIPCMVKDGLNLAQLFNATAAMARLHGWSLTTSVDWRSRVQDLNSIRPVYEPLLMATRPGYQLIKEKYPEHFGSINVEWLVDFVNFDKLLEYTYGHRCFMDDVMVHGDCWANNLMFETLPDGGVGDQLVALVDWQLTARGSPMADLARIMSWSVSPEIRRGHLDSLLQHYYTILKSIAGDKVTASQEQMKDWYQHHFAFNVLWILSGVNLFAERFSKGEGEQRLKQQMAYVSRMKANYDDAMVIVQNDHKKYSLYDVADFREK